MKKNFILLCILCLTLGLSYFWTQHHSSSDPIFSPQDLHFKSELLSLIKKYQNLEQHTHLEKAAFLEHEILADPQFISKITQYLLSMEDTQSEEKEPILNRTTAINILEELLRLKTQIKITQEVESSLSQLILKQTPSQAHPFTHRLLMTEKFEQTLILSRNNPQLAQKTLKLMQDNQVKSVLKQALLTGILEAGVSDKEATQFLEGI